VLDCVWLGVSVEDQATADLRIPALLDTPAAVRWVSAEPLLGPVNLRDYIDRWHEDDGDTCDWGWCDRAAVAVRRDFKNDDPRYVSMLPVCELHRGLDWLICGGESGPGARPMHPDWARSLRDQCASTGVAFHFKQAGNILAREWGCRHPKGGDPSEWPDVLRVMDYPAVVSR
jgi:protein gp37